MQSSNKQSYWNVCRRVYLVWAIIVFIGFVATHFYQRPEINYLWLFLSLIGLGYMGFFLKKISFRDVQLLYIGLVWLLTIAFGLAVSMITFVYEPLGEMSAYLGIFWLFLMGLAHGFNGIVDRSYLYLITSSIQILAGAVFLIFEPIQTMQYLAAGIVGSAAMVGLILYR